MKNKFWKDFQRFFLFLFSLAFNWTILKNQLDKTFNRIFIQDMALKKKSDIEKII